MLRIVIGWICMLIHCSAAGVCACLAVCVVLFGCLVFMVRFVLVYIVIWWLLHFVGCAYGV